MKRSSVKKISISLLMVLSLIRGTGPARPVLVFAADAADTITIEKTYETTNREDPGAERFSEQYEADGYIYDLINVTTVVIDEMIISGETYDYESPVFVDDPQNHLPAEKVDKEDGVYVLQKSELKEGKIEERSKYVESDEIYNLEYIDQIPKTIPVTTVDESSGQEITQSVPIIRTEEEGTYWSDTFTFPITITDYDTDKYYLGDVLVSSDEPLINHAKDFLAYLALPEEYYQITSIDWSGEAYIDNGIVVRNAVASGKKRVTNMRVTYGGDVVFPAAEGKYWLCTYVLDTSSDGTNEEGVQGGTLYQIKATATYSKQEEIAKSWFQKLLEWILQHPVIAIGITLLLLILMIVIILYILSKKEQEKENQGIEDYIDEGEEDE